MAIDDFRTQAEAMRGLLGDIGVTGDDYKRAEIAKGLLDIDSILQPPKHYATAMREEMGTPKFLGKAFFGEMAGPLAAMFAPDYLERKIQYAQDVKAYGNQRENMLEIEALQGIDPTKPGLAGIALASDVNNKLGDYYTSTYIGNQNQDSWLANQARRANMSYTEFMDMDVEARNALIYRNASEEERKQLDWLGGRQTTQQKADDASAVTTATEQAKVDVQNEQAERSQSPQMQVAFDTINDVLNKGDYHSIYGVVDSRTPDVLQSSQDVKTQMEKVGAILYMFARGELKGQGQVTEDEAKWAMKSRSSLMDFKQGDEAARAEMMLIQRQLGQKLGIEDESMYYGYEPEIDDLLDQYAD
jgi:hypothetical protein